MYTHELCFNCRIKLVKIMIKIKSSNRISHCPFVTIQAFGVMVFCCLSLLIFSFCYVSEMCKIIILILLYFSRYRNA
jgi:hypothetical protein